MVSLRVETRFYNSTYKLPAGHYLCVSEKGDSSLHRYWDLDQIKRGSFKGNIEEASEELTSICDSAFSYRVVSDVPVGVFLSGGIDSSLLAAFLKKRQKVDVNILRLDLKIHFTTKRLKQKRLRKILDIRHTIKTLNIPDASAALSQFVDIWDEPFGDTSGIPTSFLCRLAREQVVALSADGGDEMFCGYESYSSYASYFKHLQRMPNSMRLTLAAVMDRLPYQSWIAGASALRDKRRWKPQSIARYEKFIDLLRVKNQGDLIRVMNEKGWTASSISKLLNFSPEELGHK